MVGDTDWTQALMEKPRIAGLALIATTPAPDQ
jgi:hypothetical protein